MANIKNILEKLTAMAAAEKNPTGPKFPGYWKGTDPASAAKKKMVGGAEESIIKDLSKTSKKKTLEWKLQNQYGSLKTTPVSERVVLPSNPNDPVQYNPSKPSNRDSTEVEVTPVPDPNVQKSELPGSATSTIDDETRLRAMKFLTPGQPGSQKDAPGINRAAWSPELLKKYDTEVKTTQPSSAVTPKTTTVASTPRKAQPTRPVSVANNNLIQSIADVESGGRSDVVSPKGAMGKMQVLPSTAKSPGFGVAPAKSMSASELERVGKDYFNAMLNRYGGNKKLALIAYNMGPGATDQWIARGADPRALPAETQRYVPKVLDRYSQLNMPIKENNLKKTSIDKLLDEFSNLLEYGNTQDPNQQTTTPRSTATTQSTNAKTTAQLQKEKQDQQLDITTAKSFMSGLETSAGSNLDVNAAASAVTKIADNKPLTAPEQTAISTLTPLVAKAAETPQTSSALKTSLRTAAQLTKLGK